MILTIGHSRHPIAAFLALLAAHEVRVLVDVRRFPASRRHPQFGRARLAAALAERGIDYVHVPELGGRREPPPDGTRNPGWPEGAFRDYADHALGAEFRASLDRVCERAAARRTALMCAEADWRDCHRRIIADHLLARGMAVVHVLPDGTGEPAQLTPFARRAGNAVIYDRPAGQLSLAL